MSKVIDAYDTWQRFRLLHPLSREPFVDTPENRKRWLYHIDIAQGLSRIEAIRTSDVFSSHFDERAVSVFHDMPAGTRQIYGGIADCFPGVQVYAVGSRVNGDYVDAYDQPEIREARSAAGKSEKDESDFDFWIAEKIQPVGELPAQSDRLFYLPPGEKKIPVPMWDFQKLPEAEHAAAIEATQNARVGFLITLHDQYRLSPYFYCGCGDEQAVLAHFQKAIADGKIKQQHGEKH